MKGQQPNHDLIERYLLGLMSPQERADLEAEITRNPDLAEQLTARQREHEAMEYLVQERLRTQLQQWAKQHPLREPTPRYRHLVFVAVASVLLLVVALYSIFGLPGRRETAQSSNSLPAKPPVTVPKTDISSSKEVIAAEPPESLLLPTTTPKRLFADLAARYTEQPQFKRTVVRNEEERLAFMDSIYLDLEEKRFARAIQRLARVAPEDERYISARHLIGEVHLAKGEYEKAIPFLRQAINTPDYLRKSEAEWQLALAYLHIDDPSAARALLSRIRQDDTHPYRQKAIQLLAEMAKMPN
ncbi:MAG: hypothetical protein NZM43_03475 [Saprospiraceae bacterium]|nr:hypothetical protein [Saprospiraceae bacterium]MDW8483365.1 hypothetical protein [Saprospiraceae bacterium]